MIVVLKKVRFWVALAIADKPSNQRSYDHYIHLSHKTSALDTAF